MKLLLPCLLVFGVACAKPDSPFPAAKDPDASPVAEIDRFDASFATLFDRTAPVFNPAVMRDLIPGPNEPIDMDELFLTRALGPAGERITYYGLDASGLMPSRAFTVHGVDGELVAGQLPIFESIVGESAYSDFMHVQEVHVGDAYVANSLTSVADVESLTAQGAAILIDRGRVTNWAAVPEGTTAERSFDGNPVSGFRAWHEGSVVHFLNFNRELSVSSLGATPASNVSVIFTDGMSPAEGFAVESDGVQTHNVVETMPGEEFYSSLWAHQVGRLTGFNSVQDWPSAVANFQNKLDIYVNCPVVTE